MNQHNYDSLVKSPHSFALRWDFQYSELIVQLEGRLRSLNKRANPQFSYWVCFVLAQVISSRCPQAVIVRLLAKFQFLRKSIRGSALQSIFDELVSQFLIGLKKGEGEILSLKQLSLVRTMFDFTTAKTGDSSRLREVWNFLHECEHVDTLLLLRVLAEDQSLASSALDSAEFVDLVDLLQKFVVPKTVFRFNKSSLSQKMSQLLPATTVVYEHRNKQMLGCKKYKRLATNLLVKALHWAEQYFQEQTHLRLLDVAIRFSQTYKVDMVSVARQYIPEKIILRRQNQCEFVLAVVRGQPVPDTVDFLHSMDRPFMARRVLRLNAGQRDVLFLEVLRRQTLLLLAFQCNECDVTFRLYFVGDLNYFFSEEPVKIQLVETEKLPSAQHSIMVTKDGYYMMEFDNSYSWFTSKTVQLEYALIEPAVAPVIQPLDSLLRRRHKLKTVLCLIDQGCIELCLKAGSIFQSIKRENIKDALQHVLHLVGPETPLLRLQVYSGQPLQTQKLQYVPGQIMNRFRVMVKSDSNRSKQLYEEAKQKLIDIK